MKKVITPCSASVSATGTTTLVDHPVVLDSGATAAVKVTCTPRLGRALALMPRGDVVYCTVTKKRKSGVVRVTTYGWPLRLVVAVSSPATDDYSAYKKTRSYRVGG